MKTGLIMIVVQTFTNVFLTFNHLYLQNAPQRFMRTFDILALRKDHLFSNVYDNEV